MLAQLPRVLFAAASSGSGKTTVTSGILRCLDRRGANVHAYKCGPDYIDPMFHRSVLNTPCRTLDLYFSTEDQVRTLLAEKSGEGKTQAVKALLYKYDAGKLSGVKPEDYAALMEEARKL